MIDEHQIERHDFGLTELMDHARQQTARHGMSSKKTRRSRTNLPIVWPEWAGLELEAEAEVDVVTIAPINVLGSAIITVFRERRTFPHKAVLSLSNFYFISLLYFFARLRPGEQLLTINSR